MKKALAMVLALAMMTTTMTGCGGQQGNSNSSTSNSVNQSSGSVSGGNNESNTLDWPKKDINIVLGYNAGGDSDVCTRYMACLLYTSRCV